MKRSSWSVFETIAMRDTKLETKLRLVALQLENWKKLHDLITYGLDKAKPIISTEQERQFTEIRANLLQEIEYVLRELNILAEVSGKAMSVLQRGVSVRGVRDLSNDEVRRLETDWNGVFTKTRFDAGPTQSATQGIGRADGVRLLFKPPFATAGDGTLRSLNRSPRLLGLKNLLFFAKFARDCAVANDSSLEYGKTYETRHCCCDQQPDRNGATPGLRHCPTHPR